MFLPWKSFSVPEGILSVIGSGGKTTLLRFLAETLPGTVIITTTTHIFPFADIPLVRTSENESQEEIFEACRQSLSKNRVICLGTPLPSGKLSSPCPDLRILLPLAGHILTEADGSAGHPLKAHRSFEPVIPEGSSLTVCLIGASGIGKPVREACHCPDLFSRHAGISPDQNATTDAIARVINKEDLADLCLVNQTDILADPAAAIQLCEKIRRPSLAGSLLKKAFL